MTAANKLDLSQFFGSAEFQRFGLTRDISSEGVTHFAEEMGAFWLLDTISALLVELKMNGKDLDFAVVKIDPTAVHNSEVAARIVIEDGNYEEIHTHQVGFTDLDFDRLPDDFQIWAARNELDSFTLYLPSEH